MAAIEKRTASDGKVSYRVKVRLKGRPAQSATFSRLTDAKKWAQQTEAAIREGRYFKTAEAQKHTFGEVVDRYLEQVQRSNPKRYKDVHPKLVWWKSQLGHATLSQLTKSDIIEARDKLNAVDEEGKAVRSPATINRYMTAMSHAFTVAMNEWDWLEQHPMRKISKFSESRGRVRFLSDAERKRFLSVCQNSGSDYLYIIVVLALSTGARRGEIMNLRWGNVDFKRSVIVLHETKNKERRLLPLAGLALQLMTEHQKVRRLDTDYVFPAMRGDKPINIQASWDKAVKDAELEDFRFHDLRHSAASYLAMNGASLAEIAEVLGHKTLQMVKRYAHLSEAHTASVVAKMNEKVFG